MRRKYKLGNEYGSVCSWKEKITMMRNEKNWEEEVSSKSTLKWYKLARNGAGMEMYVRSGHGKEGVDYVQSEHWFSWVVRG